MESDHAQAVDRAPGGASTPEAAAAPPPSPGMRLLAGAEDALILAVFTAAALLPLLEAVLRQTSGSFPGAAEWTRMLVLALTFLGGLYAARGERHLTLSATELLGSGRVRRWGRWAGGALSAATAAALAVACTELVRLSREDRRELSGGIPVWVVESIMPVALGLLALRFAWLASSQWWARALAALAIAAGVAFARSPEVGAAAVPLMLAVVLLTILGAPVFVGLAALSLLLFAREGQPAAAVSVEIYRLVSSPVLPAIPLLTACGYVLADSEAPRRLLRFFRALLGWMPGGIAVITIAVCTVFTAFTGGSGLTVVALGGLVYPMLVEDGYPESFALGLVTATGSLGLLFPPSLPVILYSVVAGARDHNVPVDALYLAGLVPGLLMMAMVAGFAIRAGIRLRVPRRAFSLRELGAAAWEGKWELALPFLVIGLFATGLVTMVETAALAFAYAAVVETLVLGQAGSGRRLLRALLDSLALTGSVLMLLSAAMGITSYIVDAGLAEQTVTWVKAHVHSVPVFLLALNGLLIVAGALLDEYSAIVVLAPLIATLGASFGVHPVHLGVVFLSNLQLGYILPPIGLCLFLASSRFGKSLAEVVRATVPFAAVMAAAVLLVTYLPALTTGVLELAGMETVSAEAIPVP